ncbi:hypothetical protein BMS3Abin07_01629 [bacterium BMS3Abin07]|nr:hypothetical protein BMS3Abin07_01629 [bacterium BMS3Abin07]GBE33265.1 hypothetical protein BMS3Bbin05_02204 [bacterium BMS3Bbin05]HDL19801.1 M48 family peptidase [Nitrospirota bacterium]HDO23104.1 M48 family peptidase [Nitrospirota bacterium]HDZ87285.1 M48 family peptidase [Nitrospirota bacterium]
MNNYLIAIFIIYILITGFGYWLEYLNIKYLKKNGDIIPAEFEGHIDQPLLSRTRDYTVENSRFGIISSVFSDLILLLFIFGGILDIYNSWVSSLHLPFIVSGLIFFLLLTYIQTFLEMPFGLYRTFRIEKKYGFNTMTIKLWITDTIKSLVISTIILSLLIACGLLIIKKSPDLWWFWVWCFFFSFSMFIMYLSPYVIEPLFNKFKPVDDEELVGGIINLMSRAGIKVSRVFRMDASKRTKHTNAYFSGIGRTKRIVLFDTLLKMLDHAEILSVLAHEAGHWKKRHILKSIIATEIIAFIVFYIAFHLLRGNFLAELFRIKESTLFAKLIVLGFLGSIASFPLSPLFNYLSRRHEREADDFSCSLIGDGGPMISSLVKLSRDNLSNLHPHPFYAAFHYSHPPVIERIKRLKKRSRTV